MTRYRVIIQDSAQEDINGIVRYISKTLREPGTARSMAERFRDSIQSLAEMPERFPIVPDAYLQPLKIRSMSVGNYLVFFVVEHGKYEVNVLRVLHGRRNWSKLLPGIQ